MRTAVPLLIYYSSFPALLGMDSRRGNLVFSTTGGSSCCGRVASKSRGDVPEGDSTRKGSGSGLQILVLGEDSD